MNGQNIKLAAVMTLALVLMAALAAVWPASPATAEGGIIKPVKVQRLISNTTYLATDVLSTFVTSGAFVGDFGSVQYQIKAVIPDDEILGPRIVTWTPQFSIQAIPSGGTCDSLADWFDGTVYQQTYINGAPVAWTQSPVSARTTGNEIIGFEASAAGACTRIKIAIGALATTLTGTVDIRALNRQ